MRFRLYDHIKTYRLCTVCGFLFVFMFLGYLVKPDTAFSEFENRYLAGRPAFRLTDALDGSFEEKFETYTEEQVPLREQLIRLKALVERAELKRENNGIILADNGQLFEKMLSYPKNLARNEDIIVSFLEKAGRDITVGIIPNSFELQSGRLPKGVPNVSEKTAIDSFYEALSGLPNCQTIDLYGALNEHAGEEIYYHTDHHWTTAGAYYGYAEICRALGLDAIERETLPVNKRDGFYGTYYAKYKGIGVKPDTIEYYGTPKLSYVNQNDETTVNGLYDLEKLDTYDKYAMFMYGNPGQAEVIVDAGETAGGGKSLILLKDSYSNCLIPFLTYNYDRITVIDLRYFGGQLSQVLAEQTDADIVLLYNFSHLGEDSNYYKLLR